MRLTNCCSMSDCICFFTNLTLIILSIAILVRSQSDEEFCNRQLPNITTSKSLGDNGFKIKINGNPEKYIPGELYTIVLQGHHSVFSSQTFIEFMLLVEPREKTDPSYPSPSQVGTFQLYGDTLIQYSDQCPNAIVHTSDIQKREIQVMWQAPVAGSGCVIFKATVAESYENWFMDDGALTKHFCEQEAESLDEQPEVLDECCACGEAKYEVIFEGLWSKNTHPKDFPHVVYTPHFSEIIGASHTADFRVWEYGGYASDGLKALAENRVTKKLETELKSESNKIRTIIKARGLWEPNLNGKTFAVFRVDKKHHLMSLASSLGPSPDWIVGLSALELCLKNCSWISEKHMNLYLWDVGTNSAVTYLSPKQATVPQERIHRITSTNPSKSDSPFYDPTGAKMKPLARLTVNRQRVYEKNCPSGKGDQFSSTNLSYDSEEDKFRSNSDDCQVTDWTEFMPCSVTCGQGVRMRTRNYLYETRARAANCRVPLIEKEVCEAECVDDISCATTTWSEWSECSATCGKGFKTRTRRFMNRLAKKVCTQVDLVEKVACTAPIVECPNKQDIDPKCNVTQWSEWSPCTVTCGKGMKIRTRFYISPVQSSSNNCQVELIQKAPCNAAKPDCAMDYSEAKDICITPKESGPCRGYYPRWYYDVKKGMCLQFIYGGCRGNKNNFERYTDCNKMCEVILRDFVRAPLPPSTIAYAYAMKDATVHLEKGLVCAPINALTTFASNPSSLVSTHQTFSTSNIGLSNLQHGHLDQPIIDCVVTPWGEWSPCSKTCGNNGRMTRRRMIKLNPQNGGKPCPQKLVQRRKCQTMPPCRSF